MWVVINDLKYRIKQSGMAVENVHENVDDEDGRSDDQDDDRWND